ncbi:transposase [bacterium]
MARKLKVTEHLAPKEIQEKLKTTIGFWRVQRWSIIYHATVEKSYAKDIAKRIGVSRASVNCLVSRYNRFGVKGVDTIGKQTRPNAYLNKEQESKFLEAYKNKAASGKIVTVTEIHKAFEKKVGEKVSKSTVYRLLKRNNWRKIEPRPMAEESKEKRDKTQAAFKKTLKKKSKR